MLHWQRNWNYLHRCSENWLCENLSQNQIRSKMTNIPKLFDNYPDEKIRIVISAINRTPNWVLYQIHQSGLWDDLFCSMLFVLCETDSDDLKLLYNLSQKAIYRFLKENGYRKVKKMNSNTQKINSLWERKENVTTE